MSIQFDVEISESGDTWLKDIFSFNDGVASDPGAAAAATLYFEGNSYLEFNNYSGSYFEANLFNNSFTGMTWQSGTDCIGKGSATVEIQLTCDDFAVYVDGVLVYDLDSVEEYNSEKTLTTDYSVPGELACSNYTDVLLFLRQKATYFNLGWGSYWAGGYQGTIRNVVLSALPLEEAVYSENHTLLQGTTGTDVTSFTAQGDIPTNYILNLTATSAGTTCESYALNGDSVIQLQY